MKVIYITLQVKMGLQKEKLGYRGEGTLLLWELIGAQL